MVPRTKALLGLFAISAELLMISWPAEARTFPDVPTGSLYTEEIDQLSDRGIIQGNPDGSFRPNATVNRAELLTMLYRATGKEVPTFNASCFNDVPKGAWFMGVVCSAAENGYVNGYSDGGFRPGNAVNRVEALKMVQTVFGFRINQQASLQPVRAYTDVSLTAWYAVYMSNAFEHGILPVAGQTGSAFNPEKHLTRGEAAAYIFNALGLVPRASSSSSDSTSSAQTRSSRSSSSAADINAIDVDFPFGDDVSLERGDSKTYLFSLSSPVTAVIEADVEPGKTLDCRLYKIEEESSFSFEYYLGQRIGHSCTMRVSLGAGNYQFDLLTRGDDVNVHLESQLTSGDGNDGFRQATRLQEGKAQTGFIQDNDYGEWYKFTLTREKQLRLTVSNEEHLRCLIYPMEDVNLFGFAGPECNSAYLYPKGTYYVGIVRRDGDSNEQSFTVELR